MASVTVQILGKNVKVLNAFIDWYVKNYQDKLDIKTFLSLPFEYQYGIFINFFEEVYNYAIHADRESYVIFYPDIERVKDFITDRPGKLLDKDNIEYTDFNSIMLKVIYNHERAILKVIELIVNPF